LVVDEQSAGEVGLAFNTLCSGGVQLAHEGLSEMSVVSVKMGFDDRPVEFL